MQQIGILQGRLTPSRGRGIQFFPTEKDEWEREFVVAKDLGLSHIQWAFDTSQNPLLDTNFRHEVKRVIRETRLPVRNMDFQMLVVTDIATCSDDFFTRVCQAMYDIDGGVIEVPLLDASSLLEESAREPRLAALMRLHTFADAQHLSISIETDLPPDALRDLLRTYSSLGVVYDSGNSAGLGYNVEEELAAYGERVSNVHIKDKKKGGATVPLGMGDANFTKLFARLGAMSYGGPITLQAARGEDGQEKVVVVEQIQFVQEIIDGV